MKCTTHTVRSMGLAALGAGVLLAITGCSEAPQTASPPRSDMPAYNGTGVAAFTQPGWTVGDKASWASELRTRAQQGQNDYYRAATAPAAK